jgi:uncharacterized membrane protein YkvA (DUF1232 family)
MNLTARLKERAKRLKNEILAISLAFNEKRTPLFAKIMIGITAGYALSPIDLIPDFIPVLGYLDDLVILPALVLLSIKLIPGDVLEDCRGRVKEGYKPDKRTGWIAAVIIVFLWAVVIGSIIFYFLGRGCTD